MSSDSQSPFEPITSARQAGIFVHDTRVRQGLSQDELARRANISRRQLSALERGHAPGISLSRLLTIFHALGITLGAVLPSREGDFLM